MGEIILDSIDAGQDYTANIQASGFPKEVEREGRKYVQFPFLAKMNPFTRVLKTLQALAITLFTLFFALISLSFRKFWGEVISGKETIKLLSPLDSFKKSPLVSPKKNEDLDIDQMLSSLKMDGDTDSNRNLYNAAKKLIDTHAPLEDLIQPVTDFVEGCLKQFDGISETEELLEKWEAIEAIDLENTTDDHLKKIFYEAARIYKDYKMSDQDKLHDKITQMIPLDKPCMSRSKETTAHDKTEDDFVLGEYNVSIRRARGERPTMEDTDIAETFIIEREDGNLEIPCFGVFDGHSGKKCSAFLKNQLINFLEEEFKGVDLDCVGSIDHAFKLAFVKASNHYKIAEKDDGSTAIIACIIGDFLWVVNTGDSRAVLNTGGKAFQLSKDARAANESDQSGVINRGGKIMRGRVGGGVAVTRSIGDHYAVGMSARPHPHIFPLSSLSQDGRNQLIIACDGLFDLVGSEEAVNLANDKTASVAAEDLLNEAFARGTTDNVTVMVIDFN